MRLLDASVAADERARRLEPRVRTSVAHTWFLLGEYARVVSVKLEEVPYIGALSLAELDRTADAVAQLRELEARTRTRLRDFMIAARALLENHPAESIAAVERVAASDFRDPEGLFYLTRHLAHLGELDRALDLFRRRRRRVFLFSCNGARSLAGSAPAKACVHQTSARSRSAALRGCGDVCPSEGRGKRVKYQN
jgi:hypothetical protein